MFLKTTLQGLTPDAEVFRKSLSDRGVNSYPIIRDEACLELERLSNELKFVEQAKEVGQHKVRQNLSVAAVDNYSSPFWGLGRELAAFYNSLNLPGPVVSFESVEVLKYYPSNIGISPHRDFPSPNIIVALCNITGGGEFCVCDDRQANGTFPLDSNRGSVVTLRAPGYDGIEWGPFHYVRGVIRERLVVVFR